jgi:hypothetical protein
VLVARSSGHPLVYHAGLADFNRGDFVQCCNLKMVKIIDQPAHRPFSPGQDILKRNFLAACHTAAIAPTFRSPDL